MINRRQFGLGAASAASLIAAPALGQDARAKTLRMVPQANLTSLDPIWTTATVTGNHGVYVFDTLFGHDLELNRRPQMAEGYELSPDGRVWRIKLREGLKFHDNTPVLAVDCVQSLKRWAQRDPFGQLIVKVTDSWAAIDDRTFEMRLTRPFPALIDALAKIDGPAFIMPARIAATDATKQISEIVGSGPYKFAAKEYNSGNLVVYEKFAGYVPRNEPPSRDAGGKVAHFERIEWHIINDPATAANALIKGEVDWWERPTNDLAPLLAKSPDIVREVIDPTGRLSVMRFNCLHPPFDKAAVRQAIRLAVVQEDYMRATQGDDAGNWTVCRSLWARGGGNYDGELADLMPGSLEAGKKALAASGYAGEKVVMINPTDFPDIGGLGEVSADLLKRMGMNVDMFATDWGTVIQRRASKEPADKGGWNMFHTTIAVLGWGNPALNPTVRGQGLNGGWFGWWSNDKVEALTAEWLYSSDAATQKRLVKEIGRVAVEEAATVPLGQFLVKTAYRKSLTGMLKGSAPYPWGLKRV